MRATRKGRVGRGRVPGSPRPFSGEIGGARVVAERRVEGSTRGGHRGAHGVERLFDADDLGPGAQAGDLFLFVVNFFGRKRVDVDDADGTEGQMGPLMDATSAIDEQTTITP